MKALGRFPLSRLLLAALALSWASPSVQAQFPDIFGGALGGAGDDGAPVVQVAAWFNAPDKGQPARLAIEATIKQGWHIYSLTQPKGGPLPTKIKLTDSKDYKLLGEFQPVPPPKVHFDDLAFKINLEEHQGRVVWVAPFEAASGVDLKRLKIEGKLNTQVCNEQTCLPPEDFQFTAALSSKAVPTPQKKDPPKPQPNNNPGSAPGTASQARTEPASYGTFQNARLNTSISGHLESGTVTPGGTLRLVLVARPKQPYHVYAWSKEPNTGPGNKPALIVLTELPSGWRAGPPAANPAPTVPAEGLPYHAGPVAWTIEISIPPDAGPGTHRLAGIVGYQACTESVCDLPSAAKFEAQVQVGSAASAGQVPLAFWPGKYGEAEQYLVPSGSRGTLEPPTPAGPHAPAGAQAGGADEILWEPFSRTEFDKLTGFDPLQFKPPESKLDALALLVGLGGGFLGGLILNVMPCVLPVIGLKIMAFVQQAGESRRRVFLLNVWYSLGLLLVFWVLATLAAFAGLGWGAQFQNTSFTIVLSSVVFVFALALLGVWEVPIPGFVGGSAATSLASKEGITGAFFKGVLTTVLATPCTGPFLGPALTWAVQQHPLVVYATFTAVGMGMALPYLVLGAFPRLIAFLPKPGAWMDTFKQLMGFILLGTVVWLMFNLEPHQALPVVALLFGLWLACWWVGRIPVTADMAGKLQGWAMAGVLAGGAVWLAFGWFNGVMYRKFQPLYATRSAVAAAPVPRPPGKYTVLIDFTADW